MLRRVPVFTAWVVLAASAAATVVSVQRRFDVEYCNLSGMTSLSLGGGGVTILRANPSWNNDHLGWRFATTPEPFNPRWLLPSHRHSYEFRELSIPLWIPTLIVAAMLAFARGRRRGHARGFDMTGEGARAAMSTPNPPRRDYRPVHRQPRAKWGYVLALTGAVISSLLLLAFAGLLFYGCTHSAGTG